MLAIFIVAVLIDDTVCPGSSGHDITWQSSSDVQLTDLRVCPLCGAKESWGIEHGGVELLCIRAARHSVQFCSQEVSSRGVLANNYLPTSKRLSRNAMDWMPHPAIPSMVRWWGTGHVMCGQIIVA